MSFPLSTFESHIPSDIANKGLDYFAQDLVDNLAQDGNSWEADVHGTETYTVEIDVVKGEVTQWFCDCPYDWGPICKHVAAVMYAILDETLIEVAAPKTTSNKAPLKKAKKKTPAEPIEEIISKLSTDEMRQLLRYFAKREDDVRSHLLTKYSKLVSTNTRDPIKNIVKSIISSYGGRHGFIEYRDASRLGDHLYKLLREGVGGDPMSTVDLCEEIITQLGKAVQHADDSSGSIGMAIAEAFEMLEALVHDDETPEEVVGYIFKMSLQHGQNTEFDNYGIDEFKPLAVAAVRSKSQANQLVAMLDAFIHKKAKEEYGRFGMQRAAHLKYQTLAKWHSQDVADAFLNANLHYEKFRQSALEKALSEKRYDDVRQLAEKGIAQAEKEKHPGTVWKWKEWLVRLAETTGDKKTLIELTERQFLDRGEMEYYRKLKKLIPVNEFSKKVESYIRHFKKQESRFGSRYRHFNHQIANILEAENRLSELMDMLVKYPTLQLLDQYFKLLAKDNQAKYIELYDKKIRSKMELTSDRSGYRECCRYLNKLSKIGGLENAKQIALSWRAAYPRRRAMLEELQKAGF